MTLFIRYIRFSAAQFKLLLTLGTHHQHELFRMALCCQRKRVFYPGCIQFTPFLIYDVIWQPFCALSVTTNQKCQTL